MSKHEEAELILRLYELRREETMRKARDWFTRDFHPQSVNDINNAMFSEHSGHLRMVVSYWDMAAALVNHGAISMELFNDTNGEHLGVFGKFEPFLSELRSQWAPQFMQNLERLIEATPGGLERVAAIRERMKAVMAELASRQSKSAGQS